MSTICGVFIMKLFYYWINCSYDYGTAFWKIKGGLFTCKCGKPNCSFSEETIKSLHIDSDNEEADLDGDTEQSKTVENKPYNDKLSTQDVTNEIDSSQNKTKLSKCNNLLEQNGKYPKPSCSKSLSVTKNESMEKIPKNGLLVKSKSNLSVKNKEPSKNVSKELLKIANSHSTKILGSKLIQKKLKQVMLKKRLDDKILNGSSSSTINKEVKITRKKSSVGAIEKDAICNGKKVSSGLVKLNNNKAYLLRPKGLSSKKMNGNIKTENTVQNDTLKSSDFRNNREISVSSDTSSNSQKSTQDLNDYDQVVDFIKTESAYEESEAKLNDVVRNLHSLCRDTSKGEYDKVKSIEALDVSHTKDDIICSQLDF